VQLVELPYKTNILPFTGGLDLVKRLRPITFTGSKAAVAMLGLARKNVAKVEPLFTFTNDKGEIEGVKYDRINVALVNAVKEQQAEIHQEQAQIKQDQAQIKTQATALQREEQEIGQQRLVISSL